MNGWYRVRRVRPCRVCGGIRCVPQCPEYLAEDDPAVTGFCAVCGGVIFEENERLCPQCREDVDNGDQC